MAKLLGIEEEKYRQIEKCVYGKAFENRRGKIS